ncbi:MAG: hypothetical protein ABFC80_00285 [Coriobacteriales bacterium]|nr:hypothetical protein [Actinomycetes bacterium]
MRTRRRKIEILMTAACACMLLTAGCGGVVETSDLSTPGLEWVNPGAPASSHVVGGDWFTVGQGVASADLSELPDRIGYRVKVRGDRGVPVPQDRVLVQPAECFVGSESFDGYTLYYSDRIALVITPTTAPMDVGQELESEDMTTTAGETRLWQVTSVEGFDAVQRAEATQKWESGAVNKMPAVLEWVEPSNTPDGPGFVRYALLGDVELDRLHTIAADLVYRR